MVCWILGKQHKKEHVYKYFIVHISYENNTVTVSAFLHMTYARSQYSFPRELVNRSLRVAADEFMFKIARHIH